MTLEGKIRQADVSEKCCQNTGSSSTHGLAFIGAFAFLGGPPKIRPKASCVLDRCLDFMCYMSSHVGTLASHQ